MSAGSADTVRVREIVPEGMAARPPHGHVLSAAEAKAPEGPRLIRLLGTGGSELRELLHNFGYRATGPDPSDCAREAESPVVTLLRAPDVAALEADMPEPAGPADPPLLVISDDASFEFRLGAARAGAAAVLPDPPDPVELSAWLREMDGALRRPLDVLVVDDDDLAVDAYVLALEGAGMRARAETDPARALGRIEAERPDVLLLDINMPGANGMELAGMVRQSRERLAMPILFLSGERDADRRLAARRIGGDDFIAKPVDLRSLVEIVRMRGQRALTLRDLGTRDSLTGLGTRARFSDELERALREEARGDGARSTVCLLDIDHFKRFNDTYGHGLGDEVLRLLARVLTGTLRGTDEVARHGGEEFAVLLRGASPPDAARAMERVRGALSRASVETAEGARAFCTFSAGLASCEPGLPASEIVRRADAALYRAKREGRDRIVGHETPATGAAMNAADHTPSSESER